MRKGGVRQLWGAEGGMEMPCSPLLYLSCWEEGQCILDEPLDLDLHSGQ